MTLVVLALALIVILALWGKIPGQPVYHARAPPNKPPATSNLSINASLHA